MQLTMYQVDAFAKHMFEGNPAAVVPLTEWLDDQLMQKLAMENNLSETVFFVEQENHFYIRWFTPIAEVDMCGHATLASAYVIFEILGYPHEQVTFDSKSGLLHVRKDDDRFTMDFPAQPLKPCDIPNALKEAFEAKIKTCYKAMDYLIVFDHEEEIRTMQPDLSKLQLLDLRGVIITAPSSNYDFITRFFAPKFGIDEDPVTGSAFTQLIPYWSQQLNCHTFHAKQVSQRGGEVFCTLHGNRIANSNNKRNFLKVT